LGVYLNTIKRMLETLRPTVELRMRKWVANTPPAEVLFGEMLSEVTVELRTTYRATLQGVVEKLYENTQLGRTTSLKRVLKEVRPQAGDDMTSKLQPLSALIGSLLAQADAVLSSRVFMGTARVCGTGTGGRCCTSWRKGGRGVVVQERLRCYHPRYVGQPLCTADAAAAGPRPHGKGFGAATRHL
ncbi:hypothetical protein CLOP_g19781, partial [Closterium sp. NIES-67]